MPFTKMAKRLAAAAGIVSGGGNSGGGGRCGGAEGSLSLESGHQLIVTQPMGEGGGGAGAGAGVLFGSRVCEEVGAYMIERGMTDVAGLVRYLAEERPFNTPLSPLTLAEAVEAAEARALGCGGGGSGGGSADSVVEGHVPGAGLGAAVRELAGWRLTGGSGWATLAAAVLTAAEDSGGVALLLDAAAEVAEGRVRVAPHAHHHPHHHPHQSQQQRPAQPCVITTGDYCAQEDLTEFIHLLTAAMSSQLSWGSTLSLPHSTTTASPPNRPHRSGALSATPEPTSTRLAHLDAAAGYLELAAAQRLAALSAGSTAAPSHWQPASARRLTHEQHAIVSTDLRHDQIMLVRAFAGTGKTTTLLEYVRRRPGHKFAYLTFNRQVMLEAATKFPANTKCLNFHKLAWMKYGFAYQAKLLRGSLRAYHAAEALDIARNDERATLALRTLSAFLISADDAATLNHVPPRVDVDKVYGRRQARADRSSPQGPTDAGDELVHMAAALWAAMKDKDNKMPMTDGGYLKLYQLGRVDLDLQFDVILLDEAQDAAPVMADIVMQQKKCAKILVGDPHQEIYSFMGAKNAMAAAAATFPRRLILERRLACSFRFGYEIASVANSLLRLKGETACVLGARRDPPSRANRRDDTQRTHKITPPSGAGLGSTGAEHFGSDQGIAEVWDPQGRARELHREGEGKPPHLGEEDEGATGVVCAMRAAAAAAAVFVALDMNRVLHSYAPPPRSASGGGGGNGGGTKEQLVVLCRGNGSLFDVAGPWGNPPPQPHPDAHGVCQPNRGPIPTRDDHEHLPSMFNIRYVCR